MADIYDNYNEIEFLESEIVEDDDSAPVGTLIINVDGLAKPVESEPAQEAAEAEPTEEETVAEEATAPETVTEEDPAVAETPVAEAAEPERDAEPISVETEKTPLPTEETQETPAAEESAPESAEVKPEVETNEAEKEPQTAAPVSEQSEDDKPAPAKKKTSKATTKSATEDAAAKPKAKPKKAAETVFQSAADDGNVWGNAVINTQKSKPKKENAALSQEEAKQEESAASGETVLQVIDWSDSSLVAAVNIHREFVEIRQFLLNGSSLVSLLLEFRKNGVDALVVVLSQLVKTAITAVSGRKRIVLLPSTCSKLIETVCWLHCLVEIAHDKTRFILSISA